MTDEPFYAVLAECDPSYRGPEHTFLWCGRQRTDAWRIANEASEAEKKAARALIANRSQRNKLLFALNALDQDAGRDVSEYSHLAATQYDQLDAAKAVHMGFRGAAVEQKAVELHAVRETEALAQLLKPASRWKNLRDRIIAALAEMGVKFDHETLHMARPHVGLLRSWEQLRHYPQYPQHARCRASMVLLGLLR
jgi:hypothetical protein